MEKNKKLILAGAAALLIFGLIAAASAFGAQKAVFSGKWGIGGKFGRHMTCGNATYLQILGLSVNATPQEISDAMWANNLKHLGLTDESTLREYRQAIAAKMQANRLDREMAMKQRLNLTADATQDELQAAIAKWRSDNKELLFAGSRGPKSGKRDAGLGFGMMAGGHGYARGCPAGQSNEASGQQN